MGVIFSPASEAEIAEAVHQALAQDTPLEITGGGTRRGLGRPVQAAGELSLARLSGIELYEPGALTLVARAGTPLSEIEAELARNNQRLAFEPMDHRPLYASEGAPTIGGVVAANISGPRRIQAGACRDFLLGVRFINGRGEVIRNGGRVMKNVTGLDLVKLMAGSHGTLGVLSEVSFKVLPDSERQATLEIPGLDIKEGVAALSKALGSPFEVTGAAYIPASDMASRTLIRVEGFDAQVTYRVEKLKELVAANADTAIIQGKAHEDLWKNIRDAAMFAGTDEVVWRLSVKPGDAPSLYRAILEEADARMLFDWGGGLIWVGVQDGQNAKAGLIRRLVRAHGGHATLMRGPAALRSSVSPFQPLPRPVARLSEEIRKRFDPAGIFNPGRMFTQGGQDAD